MAAENPMNPAPSKLNDGDARTSRLPEGTLERIAQELNAEKSQLSMLFVSSAVTELYLSITEYAALSCTPETPNPLQVEPLDPYEPRMDDEPGNEESIECFIRSLTSEGSYNIRGGKSTGKRRASFPKFKLGLGETTMVWPPPPKLEAEKVAADRVFRMTGKHPEIEHSGSEEQQDIDVEANRGKDVSDESITIRVLHYTYGEPQLTKMSSFLIYQEVLLVTKASTEALQDFAQEVIQWRIDKDHRDAGADKFALYRFKTGSGGGTWKTEGLKRARPKSSVVLADGQLDLIMEDTARFLSPETKQWYVKHGLPCRRSLLFYGPPGTGKTSTIRVIASTYGLSCCYLSMTNAHFSNQLLADALSKMPPNALLVLEDVDALFNLDRKSETTPSLTFSGLLNALDGVISSDGILCILTTNHLERLDPALVRGGRVDRRFYFGHPNTVQLIDLFMTFYPKAEKDLAKTFAQRVMDRPEKEEARSIATLQQLFIHMREGTAEECVEAMDEFFKLHFPGKLSGPDQGMYM